jgi:hypothetical protein
MPSLSRKARYISTTDSRGESSLNHILFTYRPLQSAVVVASVGKRLCPIAFVLQVGAALHARSVPPPCCCTLLHVVQGHIRTNKSAPSIQADCPGSPDCSNRGQCFVPDGGGLPYCRCDKGWNLTAVWTLICCCKSQHQAWPHLG